MIEREFLAHLRDPVTRREMGRAVGRSLHAIIEQHAIEDVRLWVGDGLPHSYHAENLALAALQGYPPQPRVAAFEKAMDTPASEMVIDGGANGHYVVHLPTRSPEEVDADMTARLLHRDARLIDGAEHRWFPVRNVPRMTAEQIADAVVEAAEASPLDAGSLAIWVRHAAAADWRHALHHSQSAASRIVDLFIHRVLVVAQRKGAREVRFQIGSTYGVGGYAPREARWPTLIDPPRVLPHV